MLLADKEPIIQEPDWVTDDTAVPEEELVFSKRALHTLIACKKLRICHNAMWLWVRGKPLTPAEGQILSQVFPETFPGDPPTELEADKWLEEWWKPRNTAAHHRRALLRQEPTAVDYHLVDLENLI